MFFNPENWNRVRFAAKDLKKTYLNSEPFPHISIDNLFDEDLIKDLAQRIPRPDTAWWKYDNQLEKKFAFNDLTAMPYDFGLFIRSLHSPNFVSFLEELTGIESIHVDPSLNGGGIHQIVRGGKLDIHADYNFHPVTKLDRRINVLVYLNESWKSSWKGNLELWDKNMTACQKSFEPLLGRMVIFSTTDTAYHGHPDPLECPENESRKSIALYYYTKGRPKHERSDPHSTVFMKRPQDQADPELDQFRKMRAIRRHT